MAGAFPETYVVTHCVLVILLDGIEMLRDNLKKKLEPRPKASGGFRSFVGTAGWQKLKETASASAE